MIIYKSFIRQYLDYGNILYDQAYDASLYQKLERIKLRHGRCFSSSMSLFSEQKIHLMNNLKKSDLQISKLTMSNLVNTFLFGNPSFSDKIIALILDAASKYILSIKRSDGPLF